MTTWRVTVKGEADAVDAFKNDRENYKSKISEAGGSATFEFPESLESDADALIERAKAAGLEASKETYTDPLDAAGDVAFEW